jgi:hypothetical protein
MAYRFTNTDKWNDAWFSVLKPNEKLLFLFITDNCDIAGIIEINKRRWASETGLSEQAVESALKGLTRCFILSNDGDCLYIRNFIKHQKNFPLNKENKAHSGIIKRLSMYLHKFGFQSIEEFIQAPSKGLLSPIGIGNGIGSGKKEETLEKKLSKPTVEEVKIYFKENGYTEESGAKAWNYYNVADWKDSKGNKVLSWKQKMQSVWFKDENKIKSSEIPNCR